MALIDSFTGLVVDLDGVVYRGDGAVEHAVDALAGRPGSGVGVMYATNNAARPAAEVAEHLTRLGIPTRPEQVVTSAQAGAAMIAERLDEGATVLAVGGPGVALALREVNLEPVSPQDRIDDDAVAGRIVGVLQGYGKELTWSDLQEAAYAVRAGALWQATNTDLTIPTGRGISPGNGSAVAAVRNAVDVDPLVAGKPYPPLYELCAQRLGESVDRILAVGDRLDTDIEGAHAAGMPSLLVLTGINRLVDAAAGPAEHRPTFVARDLRALDEDYVAPTADGDAWTCGEARAELTGEGDQLALRLDGGSPIEQARAALACCWTAIDDGRAPRELTEPIRATLTDLEAQLDQQEAA